MNKGLAGALIAALSAASGCGSNVLRSDEVNPAPCPNIVVLADAARVVEFDGEERVEDVAYSGEIINAEVGCRYSGDRPIQAAVELEMAFGKGPKGEVGEKYFTYFVAVVRKDLEVIAKQDFIAPVDFSERRTIVVKKEDIDEITIPRRGENISGVNFEIIVGFDLTAEQAIFNRSGKSLKFPNIQ
ncbi:MAG: hypothetical protein AAGD92_03515 [Pseudomonadota bacterium]